MTKLKVRLPSSVLEATPPSSGALMALMDEVRPYFADGSVHRANDLPFLFDKLRGLSVDLRFPEQRNAYFTHSDVVALGDFGSKLRDSMESVEISGLLGDPWSAASLRRNEVRNASVLRWFLDPNGGHGCGAALLTYVLERAASKLAGHFPTSPSARCSVAVEECPDGDRASRVDIQIDDPAFFLLVEVKINASEQPRQVERYCNIAADRAGTRPWAVVFLTTDGRAPETAADHITSVVPVSWREIASALRRATRTASPIPRFLASTFAAHIAKL